MLELAVRTSKEKENVQMTPVMKKLLNPSGMNRE